MSDSDRDAEISARLADLGVPDPVTGPVRWRKLSEMPEIQEAVRMSGQGADDTPIGLHCPECGEPPRMVLPGGTQAFCGNTGGCRILMWDPTQTRAEMAADGVHEINLSGWPNGGGSGD